MRLALIPLALAAGLACAPIGHAADILSADAVNAAGLAEEPPAADTVSPAVAKLQILLDRAHVSPGVIDGRMGENVRHALKTFETMNKLEPDGRLDAASWKALAGMANMPVMVEYTITAADVAGPFVARIPTDYAEMARLKRLAYRGPAELLAEKFHMDEEFLKALNPGADFAKAGAKIMVAAVGADPPKDEVARIEVDKGLEQVRGFSGDGKLLVVYPATIGSADTPSPSGAWKVKGVAKDPVYSYRPEINFQQGGNDEPLKIPAGPNGPVGSVWIDLTKDTYGIHGTAEPADIGKTASHGCVRLTNWDAEELAKLVKFGTKVVFAN